MLKNAVSSKYFYNVKSNENGLRSVMQRCGEKDVGGYCRQDVHVLTEDHQIIRPLLLHQKPP